MRSLAASPLALSLRGPFASAPCRTRGEPDGMWPVAVTVPISGVGSPINTIKPLSHRRAQEEGAPSRHRPFRHSRDGVTHGFTNWRGRRLDR